jgi:rhodanese-related sulfurtransferase
MTLNIISPFELSTLFKEKKDIVIIDIREDYEIENDGKIDGAIHIPMGDLINHLHDIPKGEKIIFHCNSGSRSENILNFMIMNNLYLDHYFSLDGGFSAFKNLV